MANLKSLAKDTAVYGMSSIVGRFLNYLLVPLYTAVIPAASGGYGIVSNVYAYTAFILVFLTFGMETGFFRFANKSEYDPDKVYQTALTFVGTLALLFVVLCMTFLTGISSFLEYPDHKDYVGMMIIVVALDSFQCIPFAYLRYKKRPFKFAGIKLLNIVGNITLNLFFLLLCPWLDVHAHNLISWFYRPDYLVGYIFVSNLMMSTLQMLFFIPEFKVLAKKKTYTESTPHSQKPSLFTFHSSLLTSMIAYSFPILIFGLAGILNQTVDKMIYPHLFVDRQEGLVQLGIYSAASKIAMVMAMFTQAFRYAYEPFVFGKSKDKDSNKTYAAAMKYFFIFSMLAFLTVMFYMDIIRYLVASDYWQGLIVVPIVMGAEIFKGIYFNLSFWYKLTDKTSWGAYFSIIGCVIILALNVWLVPRYGYVASAWASFTGYGTITLLSYFIGQKKYPVSYPLKDMAKYLLIAAALYIVAIIVPFGNNWLKLAFNTLLLLLFVSYIVKKDLPLRSIPIINRFVKK